MNSLGVSAETLPSIMLWRICDLLERRFATSLEEDQRMLAFWPSRLLFSAFGVLQRACQSLVLDMNTKQTKERTERRIKEQTKQASTQTSKRASLGIAKNCEIGAPAA
eukprot:3593697-Amphidinium_carterae.1